MRTQPYFRPSVKHEQLYSFLVNRSRMCDVRYFSRDFLTEFIELYKSYPCLWKVRSKEYSDRNKKSDAYEILAEKLREVDPTADRNTVVRRINSLRSCWRKEMRKEIASMHFEGAYKPRLWYYDLFGFLKNQNLPNTFETKSETLDFEFEEINFDVESVKNDDSRESLQELTLMDRNPSPGLSRNRIHAGNLSNMKRIRSCEDDEEARLKIRSSHMTDTQPEDRFDMIGKNVATKLREIPNKQRIFAEKLINDVLFEAELGSLNRNYVLSINNSEKIDK